MKQLWTYLDSREWRARTKFHVCFLILGTIFAIAGLIVWLIIRNWYFSSWDWMVCFIGYPVIFSFFIVLLYSANHDFHDR